MKIKWYGYKETTVQKRELTIAELKLLIMRGYLEKGAREVQLIDLTCGESTTFWTSVDVLRNTWADDTKIEVINLPHSYGFEGEEGKVIILFQEAEEWNYKII